MNDTVLPIQRRPGRTETIARLLLAAALILPLLMLTRPAPAHGKAQPALLALAEARPGEVVRVIVQKTGDGPAAATLVSELGGRITRDLSIINAFAAELSARAARELASSPAVRWISLDAEIMDSGKPCGECIDPTNLITSYVQAVGASQLWNQAPNLQGQGVTVAVVDSGIASHADLRNRVLENVKFNSDTRSGDDQYGHGTHMAGIIGGDGNKSKEGVVGIAPQVNMVNVKVSDDRGAGLISDVVSGLQWVLENKDAYNIRVVNLSLNSSVPESYHTSPLNAAVEILWFNGIVVVVSAGNNGSGADNGILFPPANDPFAITVGSADDMGTSDTGDDVLASYSAYGLTADGHAKPDLVAPGTDIISLLASNGAELVKGHPDHRVDGFAGGKDYYFRMSGTSMAAAVTSGAVALLLQDEPNLTPDQVKYRLMATARPFAGPEPGSTGAGYADVYAAVHGTTTESANTGIEASQLLWTGSEPITWNSVSWNSVSWNSVSWNSVSWNSVSWNSVSWNSVSWAD